MTIGLFLKLWLKIKINVGCLFGGANKKSLVLVLVTQIKPKSSLLFGIGIRTKHKSRFASRTWI